MKNQTYSKRSLLIIQSKWEQVYYQVSCFGQELVHCAWVVLRLKNWKYWSSFKWILSHPTFCIWDQARPELIHYLTAILWWFFYFFSPALSFLHFLTLFVWGVMLVQSVLLFRGCLFQLSQFNIQVTWYTISCSSSTSFNIRIKIQLVHRQIHQCSQFPKTLLLEQNS